MITIENLSKVYEKKDIFGQTLSKVTALNDVNLEIRQGETLGLVGESGSGKSTLGNIILGLESPTSGQVLYEGQEIDAALRREIQKELKFQPIFQDPYSAMNPNRSALEIVAEPLTLTYSMAEAKQLAGKMLEEVGILPADFNKRPHEFSGGQRQRIVIARSIVTDPQFVVCDEPVSALDVSIQAQIINLLMDLQKEKELTYLFISHDLAMVRSISQRIAVMYLGNIVELADTEDIFNHPQHPYTKKLLEAIPLPDPHEARLRQANKEHRIPAEITIGTRWEEVRPNHWVLQD